MADPAEVAKRAAAHAAVDRFVRPGTTLALGTGSTAAHAVRRIREQFPTAEFDCVASSRATEDLARTVGLAVRPLKADDRFDLMLDGADEVSPELDLTKGGGGALLREKLLASLSSRLVIMVDAGKLVPALGTRFPIPVEVVPFARPVVERQLAAEGLGPRLRLAPDGAAVRTDNGNEILDLRLPAPLARPVELDERLRRVIGVVETGLFLGRTERVVVGEASGSVRELLSPRARGA